MAATVTIGDIVVIKATVDTAAGTTNDAIGGPLTIDTVQTNSTTEAGTVYVFLKDSKTLTLGDEDADYVFNCPNTNCSMHHLDGAVFDTGVSFGVATGTNGAGDGVNTNVTITGRIS